MSFNVITAIREVLLFLLYKGGKPNLREVNEPGKNPSRDLNPILLTLRLGSSVAEVMPLCTTSHGLLPLLSFEGWLDQ